MNKRMLNDTPARNVLSLLGVKQRYMHDRYDFKIKIYKTNKQTNNTNIL